MWEVGSFGSFGSFGYFTRANVAKPHSASGGCLWQGIGPHVFDPAGIPKLSRLTMLSRLTKKNGIPNRIARALLSPALAANDRVPNNHAPLMSDLSDLSDLSDGGGTYAQAARRARGRSAQKTPAAFTVGVWCIALVFWSQAPLLTRGKRSFVCKRLSATDNRQPTTDNLEPLTPASRTSACRPRP